jgi:hypothetical protein
LALKEGCCVEALQLAPPEPILCALALFLVVVWRIARIMPLGRTAPDLDAAVQFEPEASQAAQIFANKPLPKQPLRFGTVLGLIAQLRGARPARATASRA